MNKTIEKNLARHAEAHATHAAAAERLVVATQVAYPIGAIVEVELGRAKVVGEVMASGGCWWHRPGMVTIKNLKTRKLRDFQSTCDAHHARIISYPKRRR